LTVLLAQVDRERRQLQNNAYYNSVMRSEKARRKRSRKEDAAILDEIRFLSQVTSKLKEKFELDLIDEDLPLFGDVMRAAGFDNESDVRTYFSNRTQGLEKRDDLKESFTSEEWICLIDLNQLNQRVNNLNGSLVTNQTK
jgi:hypothetical protein